jgi:hypothetical protein
MYATLLRHRDDLYDLRTGKDPALYHAGRRQRVLQLHRRHAELVAANASLPPIAPLLWQRMINTKSLRCDLDELVRQGPRVPGADRVRLEELDDIERWDLCRRLHKDLRDGTYAPGPVKKCPIPKEGRPDEFRNITLLCARDRVVTLGRRRAPKGECHLTIADFIDHSNGLLAAAVPTTLSNCDRAAKLAGGVVSPSVLGTLRDVLGERFSLATSCIFGQDDVGRLERLAALGCRFGIPLLATNDVHYHEPGRRPLQDVLTCVRHGCTINNAGFKLFANGERY